MAVVHSFTPVVRFKQLRLPTAASSTLKKRQPPPVEREEGGRGDH
jgi:hypothetical protein